MSIAGEKKKISRTFSLISNKCKENTAFENFAQTKSSKLSSQMFYSQRNFSRLPSLAFKIVKNFKRIFRR